MTASAAICAARLSDAFSGRRCVSAWLGYGDVLFLGVGEAVLPKFDVNGRRVRPPFELATNFANWVLEGTANGASAESDRTILEAAIESLVGAEVETWALLGGNQIRLVFASGHVLTVTPWPKAEGIADAWSLKAPDDRILAVATDGRVAVVDRALPIREWFGENPP